MTVRNLEFLFQPRSVAVIGASTRPRSVGNTVMRNLLAGGFSGPILPVNPKYEAVAGVLCYPDAASLPMAPDLAVICTPPATVPELIATLGARGTKAAAVLSAGLNEIPQGGAASLEALALRAARPHLMRLLGPNCVGLIVPGLGLNASFAHTGIGSGRIAFVTQSGALATTVLDWARSKGIGFSHFVSLGNAADVDFGDVLDHLAGTPETRAILLYVEAIRHARKFMSAARAAARNKPVIVVKSGRVAEGARAAASHTGALAGADDVYDAAFHRAGLLRVDSIEDLFNATETLARAKPLAGDRLAVVTNGGGPGVLAIDGLVAGGGAVARLSEATLKALDAFLPPTWSRGNPVDLIGDAPVERYQRALRVIAEDAGNDALLLIHAPTAIVPSDEIALALVPQLQETHRPVFTCWLGIDAVQAARQHCVAGGIPTYDTPEDAVGAFLQLVRHRRNQEALMETPPSVPEGFTPEPDRVGAIIAAALAEGRSMLGEAEAKAVLAAYAIPVVETGVAASVDEAARVGREIGFPVALKILSRDISHKSDVGGVVLDLETEERLRTEAEAMLARVRRRAPDARIDGFTVQRMVATAGAHELIAGAKDDPTFGPVILFGQGGTAVEVVGDRAVALPPLNLALARSLVDRTRVARLLDGYRDRPPADRAALHLALTQLSQLVVDWPEITELDINPLLADATGVLALDARIVVGPARLPGVERLAIRPYPQQLEQAIELDGQPLLLRPIRPEDEAAHEAFFLKLRPEDVRFRFFGAVRRFAHSELARYTQIDYDREMAFIAVARGADGADQTLGVVRAVADPDNLRAEFAIIVRSDMKGKGLGRALLAKMIDYCRARGTGEMIGEVLHENRAMLTLADRLGFQRRPSEAAGIVKLSLPLA